MLEKNVFNRRKVLKCILQYLVDRPFPSYDLLRTVLFSPIVALQVASWMWRAGHVDAIHCIALPSPQVLKESVVERKEILVFFHFLYLARNHSGISPALVSILFDLSPFMVPTLFDPGPFFTVPLHRQYLSESRVVGVQDTSRGWFMRFIKPSPCMFVCTLVRVSECEARTPCMTGKCGSMSYVVFVCLCLSRALPLVFPAAMCIYSLCTCVWYVVWCVCTYGDVVCKCCRALPPKGENGRFVYSACVVVCVCVWYIISSMWSRQLSLE
jgi:hypothetical protein